MAPLTNLRRPAPDVLAGLVGLALVVLGVAGFVGVYDWVVDGEDLAAYDQVILDALVVRRSAAATVFFTVITTVSGPVVLPAVVAVGALAWGFREHQWRSAGLLVGAMVTATSLSVLIKVLVGRERPAEDLWVVPGGVTSASFPSGHTIGAATFLLVLGYLAWVRRPTRRTALSGVAAAVIGIGLVATSRLYLGYHFATDTVAGMALALAVLGVVIIFDRHRAAEAVGLARRQRRA